MVNQPTLQTLSVQDLEALDLEGHIYEVVDGILEEKMSRARHGLIETYLIMTLGGFVHAHQLGKIYPGDVTYILEGTRQSLNKAYKPDVSFMPAAQQAQVDLDDFLTIPPALVIEIISPSERWSKISAKVADYLKFGVKQIWLMDYEKEQVAVYMADNTFRIYDNEAILTAPDLLPDFSLPIVDIFAV